MNIIKETIDNISYIPYKDKQLEVLAVKKKRKGIAAIFGFILFIIQAVITFKFVMSVINLDILPDVILYSGIAILTIFLLYVVLPDTIPSNCNGWSKSGYSRNGNMPDNRDCFVRSAITTTLH